MNFNNLTLKTQEVIALAQMNALNEKHQRIDNLHILKALIGIDHNVIPYLIKKMDADPKMILQVVEKQLQTIPKGTGDDLFLSNSFHTALQRAIAFSHELGDEFVSLEHLLWSFYG